MPDDAPQPLVDKARASVDEAFAALEEDRPEDAEAAFLRALELLAGADRSEPEAAFVRAGAYDGLGSLRAVQEDLGAAFDCHSRALELRMSMVADEPADAVGHIPVAGTMLRLSALAAATGDLSEAASLGQRAIDRLKAPETEHSRYFRVAAFENLATIHSVAGDTDAALSSYAQAIKAAIELMEADGPEAGGTLTQLLLDMALTLHRADRKEEAADRCTEAGEIAGGMCERNPEDVDALQLYLTAQMNLVTFCQEAGRFADAEDALFRVLDVVGANEDVIARGRVFYDELVALSDEELAAGGLSREECHESRAELEKLAKGEG